MFRKFLLQNVYAFLIFLVVGTVLFLTVLKSYFHIMLPVLLLISFLINLASFKMAEKDAENQNRLMALVVKSFALRFFSYIILAVIFLLLEKDIPTRITFVSTLFILYIVFTFIEVKNITRLLRKSR